MGIKPRSIREDLFRYRIRSDSMHQSLLKSQEYSLASLRMLHPHLYPLQLLFAAHETFMREPPQKVVDTVAEKRSKFPRQATPYLMQGLLLQGQGLRMVHVSETPPLHFAWTCVDTR